MAVFVGLFSMTSRENITDRMYDIVHTGAADTGGSRIDLTNSTRKSILKELDHRFQSRGFWERITDNLIQADLKLTATEYLLLILGLTTLGALLGYVISRHPISALVAGVIAFLLLPIFVHWRKIKRRREFSG